MKVEGLRAHHLYNFNAIEGFTDGDTWMKVIDLNEIPFSLAFVDEDDGSTSAIVCITAAIKAGDILAGFICASFGHSFVKNSKEILTFLRGEDLLWNTLRSCGYDIMFSTVEFSNNKADIFNKRFDLQPTDTRVLQGELAGYRVYEKILNKTVDKNDYLVYRNKVIQLLNGAKT